MTNFETMTISELRKLALEAGLTIKSRSKAPIIEALVAASQVQQQEELQHEALAIQPIDRSIKQERQVAQLRATCALLKQVTGIAQFFQVLASLAEGEEVATENKQEQAEAWVVEMNAVETELQAATTYELFESCKRSLEMLKAEIVALGFEPVRCVTGWQLVQVQLKVEEVAQVASTPEPVETKKESVKMSAQEKKAAQEDAKLAKLMEGITFHEDIMGLYAKVKSANPDKPDVAYEVRVCARRMLSTECSCPARGDCLAKLAVDRALDGVRPTLSEQIRGVFPSRGQIEALLADKPTRYDQALKGSGIHAFNAKAIEQRLQEAA